jgi:transposase
LFGWRRRLRDAEAVSAESGGLEFVPAVVEADPPAVASRSKTQTTAGTIEVEIGDVKIRIGRGADAATLAMVLRALKVGA